MRAPRVLVTGAAGFAGGHLLDLLCSHTGARNGPESAETPAAPGHIVAWSHPGGHAPRDLPGVRWRAVDLLDRAAVREGLDEARPDVVYHCAGAAHVGKSWHTTAPTYRVNVLATHLLLDGLRRERIEARVVVTGSAAVYATSSEAMGEDHALAPSSPYALSKLAQELVALDEGPPLEVVVARAFNHVGPRQDPAFVASGFAKWIADIEAGRCAPEISVGNLEARRDLTDVRDTVRAYGLMALRGQSRRVYNVCSSRAVSVRAVLDMLLARAAVPIAIRIDPARYRPNDQPLVLGSAARIRAELGWEPQIPLEQTLDDLLTYWRAQAR